MIWDAVDYYPVGYCCYILHRSTFDINLVYDSMHLIGVTE